MPNITLTKSALFRLLTSAYPNPDDSGPIGPWGPVIREAINLAAINPQPLPPRFGPLPDPWLRLMLNPQPLPPKAIRPAVFMARAVIDHAIAAARMPEAERSASALLSKYLDDYCGTPPRPWPFPWPFPLGGEVTAPDPVDLFLSASLFAKGSELVNEGGMAKALSAASDRLLGSGMKALG